MRNKFTYYCICSVLLCVAILCCCTSTGINAKSKLPTHNITESRTMNFSRSISDLRLSGLVTLTYIQDPSATVTTLEMSSQGAPMSMWEVRTDGNTLVIELSKAWKGGTFNNTNTSMLDCKLRGRELKKVDLSSVATFKTGQYISNNPLSLTGSGASSFNIESIKLSQSFSLVTSGAAEITIGNIDANIINVGCSGASDLNISHLSGTSASFVGTGAVDYDVNDINLNTLTVSMSGASDASLSGKANKVSLSATGASDIKARKLQSPNKISISKSGTSDIKVANNNSVNKENSWGVSDTHIYFNGAGNNYNNTSGGDEIPEP